MPKFGDLVSSFVDQTKPTTQQIEQQDPIIALLGDTKKELDALIRKQGGLFQIIGVQQIRELVDNHTKEPIHETLYYALNQTRTNWYEIFLALYEEGSTLLTQNSIRQEDTSDAIVYKLGNEEIGRYNKVNMTYAIFGHNVTVKGDKKQWINNKRRKKVDHQKSQEAVKTILEYIEQHTRHAHQKTTSIASNNKYFLQEQKRAGLLDAIMPYYGGEENTFWVQHGEVDISVIVRSFFVDGHEPEQREIDDDRFIFDPQKDTIEFFDFNAYLTGELEPITEHVGYTLATYEWESGEAVKTFYASHEAAGDIQKHLHLETIQLPNHAIAKITLQASDPTSKPSIYYLISGSKKQYELAREHIDQYSTARKLVQDDTIRQFIHNGTSLSSH